VLEEVGLEVEADRVAAVLVLGDDAIQRLRTKENLK
jgi:hypothetical protein